jgi:hypothetical protein
LGESVGTIVVGDTVCGGVVAINKRKDNVSRIDRQAMRNA